MKEIIQMLPIIPEDKANHLIYGLIIFITLKFVGLPQLYSITGVLIIGLIKELIDYRIKPRVTATEYVKDILWTLFGGVLGILCITV